MIDLNKLLCNMTIDEKIGQLVQLGGYLIADVQNEVTGPMNNLGLSSENINNLGSVLGVANVKDIKRIQDIHMKNDRNKIPLMFMFDVIHGFKTIYPVPLALGCSFDEKIIRDCTRVASKEATAAGVQVTFAPMMDYVRDARWGRVVESYGEDCLLNGILGAEQVKEFQGNDLSGSNNMATCVKHFAAYGGGEAGRDYNNVEVSEHSLREYYLPAYKKCIEAGATMVMPAFNVLNGVPCTANSFLLKKVLREEWGFDGVVISDYSAIEELIAHGVALNQFEAARLAFTSGCDIEMCSSTYFHHLKQLVSDGSVDINQIDDAVMRILELKKKLGLFEDPYRGADEVREKQDMLTEQNRCVVRKAAEESAVLLKNDGILPLSNKLETIALIGPFADNKKIKGAWSACGSDSDCITVKEGISKLLPKASILIAQGCSDKIGENETDGFTEAVEFAKKADVVILALGEPSDYSGESCSRTDICLTGAQEELASQIAKYNKRIVAVTFSGRPIALGNLEKNVSALLHMWFPGTEGGNAAANLLFGYANPCGKLSMTFPKSVGQCPIYYNHTNTGRPISIDEDLKFQAFKSNYIDSGNLPQYSFGYGLSYSDFIYEQLELSKDEMTETDKIKVSITIYNNSDDSGKESVLLFMQDVCALNARPVQQLIAFKKVFFEKKERKTIEFTLNEKMLRFWDNENNFISEKGEFKISTGYADHLILTKIIKLVK